MKNENNMRDVRIREIHDFCAGPGWCVRYPTSGRLVTLSGFEETLDLLLSWKHHHQTLQRIVKPAYNRLRGQNILRGYRSFRTRQRGMCPDTFFTPVKKQRTRKIIKANPDDVHKGDDNADQDDDV